MPPRFRHHEVVLIVGTTGTETDSSGELFDASLWIGQEVIVEDARPTADQRGWVTSILLGVSERVEGLVAVKQVWFAENSLQSTGLVEDRDEGGSWRRPFDPAKEPGWRDQIELTLVPDLTKEESERERMLDWMHDNPDEWTPAIGIAWNAQAALIKRVESEEEPGIEYEEGDHDAGDEDEGTDYPFEFCLCVYPTGDGWAAFEQLISEPSHGWEHDVGGSGAFVSRWRRPENSQAIFLASGVREAQVACRYWSRPERPWLRHPPFG